MSLGLRFVSWFPVGFSMVGCLPTSSMVSLRVRPVHDSVCVSGPSPATQGACPEFGCAPPDGGWYNETSSISMISASGADVALGDCS